MARNRRRGSTCILIGVLLLIGALGLTGYNLWDENRAGVAAAGAAHALRAQTPPAVPPEDPEYVIPDYLIDPRASMPTAEVEGYDYIGVLSIPVLDLELPVMDSWSYPQLKLSPCRYEGSAYTGDLIIAAHNYQRHFGRLKTLQAGDTVVFTDAAGSVFTYTVSGLEQLLPSQGKEMREGDWDLTLFTCTVGGQQRVTVRCERVEPA